MNSKIVGQVKYITEHKLYEGSALTGWGVNQYTPMTSVTKSEAEIQSRIKTLESFCRNTEATDETIQMLLIEIRQLNQALLDAQYKATPAEQSQEPESKAKELDWEIILQKLQTF